ncbi:MAG: S49 family peptidase, partial [Deltaproteobacteria bacterium]|nr:S49 family peptidase [Deltaproteobacteria bacterium]
MKYPLILAEISHNQWALAPSSIDGLLSALKSSGEYNSELYSKFHGAKSGEFNALASVLGDRINGTRISRRSGSIGAIEINGPIIPRGDMFSSMSGITSAEMISSEFSQMESQAGIERIVLLMDTPGGSIVGISEVAALVAQSSKPTIAFVVGMAASAGYWIASSADEVLSVNTGIVGSIGVVSTIRVGGKDDDIVEIVSSQSPKKRLDVTTDEGRESVQVILDDLATVFVDTVAQNRGVSSNKVLSSFGQGDILVASSALKAGMIDGISTLSSLVEDLKAGREIGSNSVSPSANNGNLETNKLDNSSTSALMAVDNSSTLKKEPTKMTLAELLAKHPELAS